MCKQNFSRSYMHPAPMSYFHITVRSPEAPFSKRSKICNVFLTWHFSSLLQKCILKILLSLTSDVLLHPPTIHRSTVIALWQIYIPCVEWTWDISCGWGSRWWVALPTVVMVTLSHWREKNKRPFMTTLNKKKLKKIVEIYLISHIALIFFWKSNDINFFNHNRRRKRGRNKEKEPTPLQEKSLIVAHKYNDGCICTTHFCTIKWTTAKK